MKWYLLIIFLIFFFVGKYFQKKAYENLREEYKSSRKIRFVKYPISFFSDAYKNRQGILFKNLTILVPLLGFIIILLILIF